MRTLISLFVVMLLTVACTKTPPKLESNKRLVYSFKQPDRKVLSGQQSGRLGQPGMKSIGKNAIYYSANGNLCRRLSNNNTVCYIRGRWYQTVAIRAKGR